ncbi:MAG: hypothetical protein U0175_32860 [Caldilineaceae bacterium]
MNKASTKAVLLISIWLLIELALIRPSRQVSATMGDSSPATRWELYAPLIMQTHPGGSVTPTPIRMKATWSSPIAVSPLDASIWVANPDANSVTQVDAQNRKKLKEIAVGQEPWSLAIAPDGKRVYVLSRADGSLAMIDTHALIVTHTLSVGTEPANLVLAPDGTTAYVSLLTENAIVVIDLINLQIISRITVDATPYALAITEVSSATDKVETLYVTHLLSLPRPDGNEATDDGRMGRVTVIDTLTNAVIRRIDLLPNAQGFPSRNMGIAIAGQRAWLPHVRAAPALPRGLTTTLFAAISSLDLAQENEDPSAYIPLNDQEIFGSPVNNPSVAIPSADGTQLYVVLAGSDLLEVVDISYPNQVALLKFIAVGKNPQGMAISADGRQGYVMNYLSRSITLIDLEHLEALAEIKVSDEPLDDALLQGKILFNNAANPKLAQGSWISCASCHFEGLPDGITWIFPDGPRQTPMLWNAGATLPWHWSAALDEPQDVEDTIQRIQHGLGLAAGNEPALLAAPLAGRSTLLDDLALFTTHGIRPVHAQPPEGDVALGRATFIEKGCAECHGGADWTISALPGAAGTLDPDGNGMVDSVLRAVGTLNPLDQRGDKGFDVPSLLNVGLTAPYFHDGSVATLEALLATGHPNPAQPPSFSPAERTAILIFLHSLDATTVPIDTHKRR